MFRNLTPTAAFLALALFLGASAGCGPETRDPPSWKHRTLVEGGCAFLRAAAGDADLASPGLEIAAIDEKGAVFMVFEAGQDAKTETLYEHGSALYAVLIADVDPTTPGIETYAAGTDENGKGGGVVQIVRKEGKTSFKRVWTGNSPVTALACLPPAKDSKSPELAAATEEGEVLALHPVGGDGKWLAKSVHKEPGDGGKEGVKIEDMLCGPVAGNPARTLLICARSGRCVLLDPEAPGKAIEMHREEGGIARAALWKGGELLLACSNGRLLHAFKKGEAFGWVELYADSAGLAGLAAGDFPLEKGKALVCVAGDSGSVIALEPGQGLWKPSTLFTDTGAALWLAAADVVKGNGAVELILCGKSKKLTLLYRE